MVLIVDGPVIIQPDLYLCLVVYAYGEGGRIVDCELLRKEFICV